MSFEKSANPSNKNSKQIVILLVLGAVLAVIVGRMVMNHPDNVSAAALDPAAAPQITTTPDDALKDLSADPTALLLRGSAESQSTLDNAPPDPFAISPRLRAALVAPVPVEGSDSHTPAPVAVDPAVPKVDPATIALTGIFTTARGPIALVNGQIVHKGSVLDKVRIVAIKPDRIVCQPAQGGASVEIPLAKQ